MQVHPYTDEKQISELFITQNSNNIEILTLHHPNPNPNNIETLASQIQTILEPLPHITLTLPTLTLQGHPYTDVKQVSELFGQVDVEHRIGFELARQRDYKLCVEAQTVFPYESI